MLTDQLATEIVKRTMEIMKTNINIMDRQGMIIGSGDVSRLGQLHTGAKKVVQQQTTIEITSIEAKEWEGTLPGINLPIRFQDEIVGVIGITGEPDEIRGYSQLVQMGAELTLEQAFLTKEIQRNRRIREDILSHLLLGAEREYDYILERTRFLNIDIKESYAVILLAPLSEKTTENPEKIESWLRSLVEEGDEYVRLYTNQYVILKKKQPYLNTKETLTVYLNQKWPGKELSRLNIAHGPFLEGIRGWRNSFKEARTILEVAGALYPEGGVWNRDHLSLEMMCFQLWKYANKEAMKQVNHYMRLFSEKEGHALHKTLLTYVRENGKIENTARKLFIHRNTLAYRLEKIHRMTGKDPKNLQDLMELHIGQILYLINDNKHG
jgi:carbohydrate diacid regulator